MKKLWNHYDPLDFENIEQGGGNMPEPPAVPSIPHKKRSALDRLYAWLFHAEEENVEFEGPVVPQAPLAPQAISAPTSFADHELRLQREQVQQALNDWKAAAAYFESVADPELVDYAVYGMEAAQKRYIYLLRSAGREDSSLELRQ